MLIKMLKIKLRNKFSKRNATFSPRCNRGRTVYPLEKSSNAIFALAQCEICMHCLRVPSMHWEPVLGSSLRIGWQEPGLMTDLAWTLPHQNGSKKTLSDCPTVFAMKARTNENRFPGRWQLQSKVRPWLALGTLCWALQHHKKKRKWDGNGKEKFQPKLFISQQTRHHWLSNKTCEIFVTHDLSGKI